MMHHVLYVLFALLLGFFAWDCYVLWRTKRMWQKRTQEILDRLDQEERP